MSVPLLPLFFSEEFALPAVTVDFLKEEKGYGKAAKKYIKEYEGLQKKQNKERNNVISNQCKTMEKLANKKKFVIYFLDLKKIICQALAFFWLQGRLRK